jgi:hypothetical protein
MASSRNVGVEEAGFCLEVHEIPRLSRWLSTGITELTMAKRDTAWARGKVAELIEVLGGKCALEDDTCKGGLEIDHPSGRSFKGSHWEPREISFDQRVRRYWWEYRNSVPLRVLCKSHNSRMENRPAQMKLAELRNQNVAAF